MDAIRKVLYGGKRRVDTATQTILEPSYVPSNGLVWGAEVVSDQLWNTYSPASPWFPSELYTGFDRPQGKYMHWFARVDHAGYSNHDPRASSPLLKIRLNVDSTWNHPITTKPIRYWDWAYGPAVVPDDTNLPKVQAGKSYTAPIKLTIPVLVEVCKSGSISLTEGCWRYGTSYKPTGLMQQYGERGNMQFGLITSSLSDSGCTNSGVGSYGDYRCNDKGGVLRHHIQRLPNNAIDSTTGQFIAGGIIKTMDIFEITDYLDILYPYPNLAGNIQELRFPNGVNTGNPVGEMAMEALRYLGGATAGLNLYKPSGTEKLSLKIADWTKRPVDPMSECVKPFVLIISDIYPAFDGDHFPTSGELNRGILPHLTSSQVPPAWSVPNYLNLITSLEGYASTGAKYYYPKTSHNITVRGLCTPKSFSGVSLATISGFCPSEPSMSGSYSLAAAAYYGHTHDFSLPTDTNIPVDFFVVGLSPSVPHVSISDGHGHYADIVPTVIVTPGYGYQLTNDPNFYYVPQNALPPIRNMINFIMKKVQADSNGVNFRVEFLTNFETVAEPNDIWERDHINNAEVTLLTTRDTPAAYREALPYYINSGPFKATYSITSYCPNIPATQPSYLACDNIPADQAYYAFKIPEDPTDTLDITQYPIVGLVVVSDATGSDTGWSAGIGYGISGVINPGIYIDVANVGHDSRKAPASQAYPYARTGVPKLGVPSGYWFPNVTMDSLLTPWNCPYAGYTGANYASLCGPGTQINTGNTGNINSYPFNIGYWSGVFNNVSNQMAYIQIRSFKFDLDETSQPKHLPNPLWLAAKYGGFKDANNNGVPDSGEWDSLRPGTPDNYFEVANLSDLPGQLSRAFDRIAKATEALTSTSDAVTSVLGGGLTLQTSYVPEYYSKLDIENNIPDENRVKIKWTGNFSSLFIDEWANPREDTLRNSKLDPKFDRIVKFVAATDGSEGSKIELYDDPKGIGDELVLYPTSNSFSIYDLKTVWDSSDIISAIPNGSFETSRAFSSTTPGRRLYSYTGTIPEPDAGFAAPVSLSSHLFNVSNADNLAPFIAQGYTLASPVTFTGTEACDTVAALKCGADHKVCKELHVAAVGKPPHGMTAIKFEIVSNLAAGQVQASTASGNVIHIKVGRTTASGVVDALNNLIYDEHVTHIVRAHLNSGDDGSWIPNLNPGGTVLPSTADSTGALNTVKNVIRFTSGEEIKGWRSRSACTPWDTTGQRTWRLGDIINSKPVIVAEPSAGYDLLYGDYSYSLYKQNQVNGRRIVSYFGSNDGILHAINVGFYGSLADGTVGYSKSSFISGVTAAQHELGSELWGYIPTSVLPHLTWATDPSYSHSYYVDLSPMVVDIKNTSGLDKILPNGQNWENGTWRTVLIGGLRLGGRTIELDNPAAPVKYLHSEYFALDVTDPEKEPILLWRFSDPSMGLTVSKPAVVSSVDGWHVIIASGPTTDVETSYTNSMGQVINTKAPVGNGGELAYQGISNQKARLYVINAYTGALQKVLGGQDNAGMPSGQSVPDNSFFNDSFVTAALGPGSSNLVTRGSTAGEVIWYNPTVYYGLTTSRNAARLDSGALMRLVMVDSAGLPVGVNNWRLTTMYKTDRPVTGSVNATTDAVGNMWIVFGTGRLWSEDDRIPLCSLLTTATLVAACDANHTQYLFGLKEPKVSNLLTYDEIKETASQKIVDVTSARVFGQGTVTGVTGIDNYESLVSSLKGASTLGYKRGLNIWAYNNAGHTTLTYEMILSQPKIDPLPNGRSNLVVSTYEPSSDLCDPEGHSYLYLVDTFSGVPSPYMDDYDFEETQWPTKITVGTGADAKEYTMISGYLSSGKGQATEAYILKGTTSTIYGNKGIDQRPYEIELPASYDGFVSGTLWWREVLDMGLSVDPADLTKGLPGAP
jgi:Tfp pilus tip-associated adhesin PilY1